MLAIFSGIYRAQLDTVPAWPVNTNAAASQEVKAQQSRLLPQAMPLVQSIATTAEAIAPDIQNLANTTKET